MNSIRTSLHYLHVHSTILDAIIAKSVMLDTGQHAHNRPVTAATPINLTAVDLSDQLHELALLLCRAVGQHPPKGLPVRDLYAMLDTEQTVTRLDTRPDRDHIRRVLHSATMRMQSICERRQVMRYIGVCTQCGYGIWADEDADITADTYTCDMCHATGSLATVAAAHRLRLMMSGITGTAAELATLLRSCGYNARRNTITQWGKRGLVHMVGHDGDGAPVYRLADILARLN